MSFENPDGLSGLDEERFIVLQLLQTVDNCFVTFPVAGGLARPAVDDQLLGFFGDLRVEVVHQHPKGRFLDPSLALQSSPPRGSDRLHLYRFHHNLYPIFLSSSFRARISESVSIPFDLNPSITPRMPLP